MIFYHSEILSDPGTAYPGTESEQTYIETSLVTNGGTTIATTVGAGMW